MTASLGSDRLDVNPAGTGSAFTVNLSPPAYARSFAAAGPCAPHRSSSAVRSSRLAGR